MDRTRNKSMVSGVISSMASLPPRWPPIGLVVHCPPLSRPCPAPVPPLSRHGQGHWSGPGEPTGADVWQPGANGAQFSASHVPHCQPRPILSDGTVRCKREKPCPSVTCQVAVARKQMPEAWVPQHDHGLSEAQFRIELQWSSAPTWYHTGRDPHGPSWRTARSRERELVFPAPIGHLLVGERDPTDLRTRRR